MINIGDTVWSLEPISGMIESDVMYKITEIDFGSYPDIWLGFEGVCDGRHRWGIKCFSKTKNGERLHIKDFNVVVPKFEGRVIRD